MIALVANKFFIPLFVKICYVETEKSLLQITLLEQPLLGFTSKKLIALFVNRSRPIKQANPKILDYISQTMVYFPIDLLKNGIRSTE
jgi:hypothetical protein